ncbi:MAG TPA: hypothetical protein VEC93_11415 [Anaerolineae bacterium]|nr:hypothetical protein [Anaerolineae bacterium]
MKTSIGPVQLIVVSFETNQRFRGDIMRELNNIRVKGLIRLLDLLFVTKDQQGNISAFLETDLSKEEEAEYGRLINQMMGLTSTQYPARESKVIVGLADHEYGLTANDVQYVADKIEPGTSAALLLIEHAWAADLKLAVHQAGGRMAAQGFLTPEVLLMVGKELEIMVEAAATIEIAQAVKGAAMLDALITVAEAEEMKETASQEAFKAVATAAERVKTAAVAKAVRSLIAAGLMERTDAEEAIETLLAAHLLETDTVTEATRIVEEAEAVADAAFTEAEANDDDDTATQPERL